MRTRPLLLSALLVAGLVARTFAQTAPATEPAVPPVAPPVEAPVAPAEPVVTIKQDEAQVATKGKDDAGRDTLSVDFPDKEIREILTSVADLFELNIIVPETLQGRTTIKLRDVTWRQIFENVLAPVSYTYIEDGNIVKIVSNESLTVEPVATEVFILNYAKAADIMPTISGLIDAAAGGKIVVDARSNALVITERPTRMNRIRQIIEQLDRATDQVMIETKFIEVTDGAVRNIGLNWASLQGYRIGVGGINQSFSRGRGQQVTDGFDATGRTANGTSNDTSNGTTATQSSGSTNSSSVTATNGLPTSTSTTGSTSSINNSATNGTTSGTTSSTDNTFDLLQSLTNTSTTSRLASALFSAADFNVILGALQTQEDTRIISNPTVVTLNNSPAVINVGEERPIPRYTYNQERGVFEVSGFEYKPIGVILKVTPQVNARGFIKLTVEPEVSQSNRNETFNGANIPIVESRKAFTQISLKDGYTMGIGGLIQTRSVKGQSKVPLLGSIPGLGYMFKSDNKNVVTSNLLIFITARTINAEGAPVEEIFDPRQIRQMNIGRDELPGYRDGSDPFQPSAPVVEEKKKK